MWELLAAQPNAAVVKDSSWHTESERSSDAGPAELVVVWVRMAPSGAMKQHQAKERTVNPHGISSKQ